MDTLAYEGMKVDLELRKHLTSLVALKAKIEDKLKDENLKSLEEEELKGSLEQVNETIGKIRFHSIDHLGIFSDNIKQHTEEEGTQEVNSGDSSNMINKQSPGSFSVSEQQTSELTNQVGTPQKINASKEVEKNTPLNRKQESYEKGFDPEIDDDSFYKSLDSILGIDIEEKMADLISPEIKVPRGTKKLAADSERSIYLGLRKAVNSWFEDVQKDTDYYSALANLKMSLINWNQDSKSTSGETVQKLYNLGLEAGVLKGASIKSKEVKHLINKSNGIGPALDNFKDSCYSNLSRIMQKHIHDGEHALYREKREIDSWLRKQRYQTRMMVKTEVAKIANFGLIESWGYDNDRYFHNYFWNAITDERTKEISRIRKSGNPYTFDEIQWLWKNQEQLINDKWQNDSFNQRCSISRERIDKEFSGNRFSGKESEFNQTM
jgi:hypothetical protein